MKARLYAAASVTALAFVAGWLVCGARSPLGAYFTAHATLAAWWSAANAAPELIAGAAAVHLLRGRGGELIYHALFAAQWFALGYWLASLASSLRRWLWRPLA